MRLSTRSGRLCVERFGRGDGRRYARVSIGRRNSEPIDTSRFPRARQHVVAHSRHSCIVRCNGNNTATLPLDRGRVSMN